MEDLNYWAGIPGIDLKEPIQEGLEEALAYIYDPGVQQFVVFALTRCSTNEKIGRALDAFHIGIRYMKARNLYAEQMPSKQSDSFFAALLLHNIWFDPVKDEASDWLKVFELRDRMEGLAYELMGAMSYQYNGVFEFIFQDVEAQLGESMPTVGNRPVNGQNTSYFWEVLWFYYDFLENNPITTHILIHEKDPV